MLKASRSIPQQPRRKTQRQDFPHLRLAHRLVATKLFLHTLASFIGLPCLGLRLSGDLHSHCDCDSELGPVFESKQRVLGLGCLTYQEHTTQRMCSMLSALSVSGLQRLGKNINLLLVSCLILSLGRLGRKPAEPESSHVQSVLSNIHFQITKHIHIIYCV